jgi:inner membrane protein
MTENKPGLIEKTNNWLKRSVTVKLVTIGILILLLLIPVSMVESLIFERQSRQEEAKREVSQKWGNDQTITGLVLTVPYKTYDKVFQKGSSTKYSLVETTEYAHFLPENLIINGKIIPEKRKRGIYEIIVYNSKMEISGNFETPSFEDWKTPEEDVLWDEAFVSLGLSDLRSIQKKVILKWNGQEQMFSPGLETREVIETGISVKLPYNPALKASKSTFSVALDFNGSSSLNFIPLGKTTKVGISSAWQHPKFDGAFLPDSHTVTKNGFSANWEILHLNRPYPQKFRGSQESIAGSSFGVNLIEPVDEYQKSTRSAKYAIMLISLTFLLFFFTQILNGVRIHPIQYILVGLALCIFYILLIALSEHIPFSYSYLVSSIAIIGLITIYSKSIFKNPILTKVIFGILIILYGFIYIIIQLEDYALLMGSIGLLLVLASVMYLSRKINWYNLDQK